MNVLILLHINVFTVTFGQFNAPLLKKKYSFLSKEMYLPQTFEHHSVAISINIEINKYCKCIFILS